MIFYRLAAIAYLIFCIVVTGVAGYLLILVIKALKKYISSKEVREEKKVIKKSLGEELKENRLRCKMTQEFVSETLGVSRQAVSNGKMEQVTQVHLIYWHLQNYMEYLAGELLNSIKSKENNSKEES